MSINSKINEGKALLRDKRVRLAIKALTILAVTTILVVSVVILPIVTR